MMAFAAPIAMGATVVGGLVKAFGDYQAAQGKAAMYASQADVASKLATAERGAGEATAAAGFRGAEQTGLRVGASIAREDVEAGAGNIGVDSGSRAQVRASQIALGQSEQAETFQKYREEQYQMDLTAAEKTAEAGRYTTAARYAKEEGDVSALGDITSTVGSAFGFSDKWYQQTGKSILGT